MQLQQYSKFGSAGLAQLKQIPGPYGFLCQVSFPTLRAEEYLDSRDYPDYFVREIIFCFGAHYFKGHFSGYFEGASTFLTPKLSLAGPRLF